ncbi:hypothetical protein, partial [Heliobacterium mobile]|uniref:hypothetical protein n=1 Tax=Heliobacterium mobile TaxID=28064 RepID=UPI001F38F875
PISIRHKMEKSFKGSLLYGWLFRQTLIAKLRIHEWSFVATSAGFVVFAPKEAKGYSAFCHFFMEILAVRVFPFRG